MVLLDALYINSGGGKVLLDYLIEKINEKKINFFFLLDDRIVNNHYNLSNKKVLYLKSGLFTRHNFYRKNKTKFDSVFTFANIPPTISLDCKVYTYFQNVLYLEKKTYNFSFFFKKIIFNYYKNYTDYYFVQSKIVKDKLSDKNIEKDKILIFPFFKSDFNFKRKKIDTKSINFIYVSSGEKHKNHYNLLLAFKKYNQIYPSSSLTLTISPNYKKLILLINKLKNSNINIRNVGNISHEKIINEYRKSDVVIFPSKNESFGLGLIEAASMSIPIISSNKDYVHQIVKPSVTFDPENKEEIFKSMINHESFCEKPSEIIVNNKIDEMLKFIIQNINN